MGIPCSKGKFRQVSAGDLADMYEDGEQFVILTAPEPQHKVRYVRACAEHGGMEGELGTREEKTRLFGKLCTKEEGGRV